MFAIIHNGKVILGPSSWDKGFFSTVLKRKKISHGHIPFKPAEELPYKLNETTEIYPVEVIREPINDYIEYHRGPLWEVKETVAVATYEIVEQDLAFAKANYKNLLAEKRYEKEISGTKVTIHGAEITINTDREYRSILTQKYTLMKEGDTTNWKFLESWITLSRSGLETVLTAIDMHVQECFDWEKQISDQIEEELLVSELVKYENIIKEIEEEEVSND